MGTQIQFTYEDYRKLPDDERYQLIEGELVREPAPKTYHQRISGKLFYYLYQYVQEHEVGVVYDCPVDVLLSQINVLQPDILFISRTRESIVEEDYVRGAPDLVVEVLSPSTSHRDRGVKMDLYARFGVREYWIVDPEARSMEVLSLTADGYQTFGRFECPSQLVSPLLPGLKIDLGTVF